MRGRMSDGPSYAQPVGARRRDGRRHGRRGRRVEATRLRGGRLRAGLRRLAGVRGVRRQGAAQARPEAGADLDRARRARHAGHDGVRRACSTSASRSRARPSWSSAASGAVGSVVGQLAKIKGCRAVGIAGGRTSAVRRRTSSASTPASTTRPAISRAALQARLPRRHRRLLRERRRRRVRRRCCALHQPVRAHPAVRPDLAVQRDRAAAGPEPAPAAGQPRADQGLHRLRPPRPHGRRSCRTCGGWCGRAGSSTARTSSTGWRTRPTAFIGLLKGKNFGKLLVRRGGGFLQMKPAALAPGGRAHDRRARPRPDPGRGPGPGVHRVQAAPRVLDRAAAHQRERRAQGRVRQPRPTHAAGILQHRPAPGARSGRDRPGHLPPVAGPARRQRRRRRRRSRARPPGGGRRLQGAGARPRRLHRAQPGPEGTGVGACGVDAIWARRRSSPSPGRKGRPGARSRSRSSASPGSRQLAEPRLGAAARPRREGIDHRSPGELARGDVLGPAQHHHARASATSPLVALPLLLRHATGGLPGGLAAPELQPAPVRSGRRAAAGCPRSAR